MEVSEQPAQRAEHPRPEASFFILPEAGPLLGAYLALSRSTYALVIRRDGTVLDANDAVVRLLRVDRDTLVGHPIWRVLTDPDAATLRRLMEEAAGTPAPPAPPAPGVPTPGPPAASPHSLLLNVVTPEHIPHTIACVVWVTPEWLALLGEPARRQNDRLQEELVHLNNQLAMMTRERARQASLLAQARDALQTALEQTRDALRARDEFLTAAAHDLRTPLAGLRGHAQLLLRRLRRLTASPEVMSTLETGVSAIEEQSVRLTRLIEQLFDLSRLESGRMSLRPEPTDLGQLVTQTVELLRPTIAAGRHEFVTRITPGTTASVDPLRIEQVLLNLLNNAIKFSPEGGRIEIDLSRANMDCVRLSVRDYGVGVPAEHREHLFDRYFQAHSDAHLSGMGLGLFLCREIVRLHGGRIEAEFPQDGGTRFLVTLPVVTDAPPLTPPSPIAEAPDAEKPSTASRPQ